jgi:hypothetical protein
MSSATTSEHRTIEPAIMASEIERLPDLEGFLKFASTPDWMRVMLSYVSYPVVREKRRGPTPEAPVVTTSELSESAVPPVTRSNRIKSPSPAGKRARKSKAENAQSLEPVQKAENRDDTIDLDVKRTESRDEAAPGPQSH